MKPNTKYVVWTDDKGKIRQSQEEGQEFKSLHMKKINKFQFIKSILFEKGFLWKLAETIKYASYHHNYYRGTNASDVVLFTHTEGFYKMWKEKK